MHDERRDRKIEGYHKICRDDSIKQSGSLNGVLNLLKPPGITSNDITRILSKQLDVKKVGHVGTLDPGAAGVLPICLGKATKLSDYLVSGQKKYRFEIVFGIETDTCDAYGLVTKQSQNYPDENEIISALKDYTGEQDQVPPAYSALKVEGHKLYEMARAGKIVEIPSKKISIEKLVLVSFKSPNHAIFDVECSKGTYIRALCRDIGRKFGCGAYMSFLLRLSSGNFRIEHSYTIDEIITKSNKGDILQFVIPMDKALADYDEAYISRVSLSRAINGNVIHKKDLKTSGEISNSRVVRVYCESLFVGIGKFDSFTGDLNMEKVLL